MNTEIEKMRDINVEQKKYYENASGGEESDYNNNATNIYRRFRKRAFKALNKERIAESINNMHEAWIGDVAKSKVLDLGLGEGNPHSLKLAKEAEQYVGIDLSRTRIKTYKSKLEAAGIYDSKLFAIDFLSSDFKEENFNFIYAMAVLHHFEYVEEFIKVLHSKLAPEGTVITLDPLETWFPAKLLRMIYRPFQKDASWEFPFTKNTLDIIKKYFVIEEVQGIYGKSKWAIPISFFSGESALKKAELWHQEDLLNAKSLDKIMDCLQISLKLRKK